MLDFKFGAASRQHLAQIDPDLAAVAELALAWGIIDFSIYESVRAKAEQDRLYVLGRTKVRWPNSKHNVPRPGAKAQAFDAAPYINGTISWDAQHCVFLAGIMLAAATVLHVPLRWGGNWDMDGEPITDQTFDDLVHYEIRRLT